MGLLTIIRKTRLKEKQIRVLMLGLDNAGKTTIVKRILGEDVNEVSPTLGFNIRTIMHQGYSLNVWDIGGQTSLRPYWRNYFETTDAVIWVVDSSDRERMEDCRRELRELLQEERLAGASLLVFANKQDIAGGMTSEEISEALQLPLLVSHTSHIQACSARSASTTEGDQRIWDGLDWVVKEVARRVYYGTGGGMPMASEVQEKVESSSATA
ncbi:ADP-ribosylation factor family-domain-containing protein [Leucosporidium creatinivorum]|uniref:ADP-ribosylation factor-like protein 2 n=1 Tax=Leucosporidium creatinivorum TaxID=106004 RepID=A0A1Y2G312_9BASI|nr:ADP-ribosylation factor family-domain-containing protein [Leucosporidium creatinivorum]